MVHAIRIQGLSKRYQIGARERHPYRTLRETVANASSSAWSRLRNGIGKRPRLASSAAGRTIDLWALTDVSLDVRQGEVVGVIGRNGAGKSTLLKILSRIVEPSAGRISLRGRVGSLLEVGTGFHPELTGRENIYMSGSVLGMKRSEIVQRFDDIVSFSSVESFIDTPIKRYSSGMQLRLAFAVAAHLEPEILLIDEVLAVGDQHFQRRCTRKMRDLSASGRTVLFVSHDIPAVQHLCTRGILLEKGRVKHAGEVEDVVAKYTAECADRSGSADLTDHPGRLCNSIPAMQTAFARPSLRPDDSPIQMGDDVNIELAFTAAEPIDDITFGFVVKNRLGRPVFSVNTLSQPLPVQSRSTKCATIVGELKQIPLMPGEYHVDLYLGTRGQNFDVILDAISFTVHAANVFDSGRLPPTQFGDIFWPVRWELRHHG